MKTVVISIGGSVILSEDLDNSYFIELKNLLMKISKEYKIFLVVGGGKTARTYINFGRQLNFNEELLDEIGIEITRINAKIVSNILEIPAKKIPQTTDEAKKVEKLIVVMGGTTPGHSTDMVGAELAEKVHADKFIIATNVDGVYDKDPNRFNDAKMFTEIPIKDLIKEYGTKWGAAGKNVIVDGPALEIIERAKISTFVLNGKKLSELDKVLNNSSFKGTTIKV